ncbi:recombinase family protein [Aureimonas frigidaquae]|uniref:recombinase family protein n=1 Tax=Aureimonas frigidaquae TaxID=424757 RepID=UPI0007851C7B|nr:recombinase family protein [Aureimonas frigidaquae]
MLTRLYLRASTIDQDAERARGALERFAEERGLNVAGAYVEHASGAALARPELFRLLRDSRPGDILLVEQIDRLTRLSVGDWASLKAEIQTRHVRIVSLDLPTSWAMATPGADEFTKRLFDALNHLMLDLLAAVSAKDYDDRRRRQAEGVLKAKAAGKFRGRPENTTRNSALVGMLQKGMSWSEIIAATGASRSTLARLAKRTKIAST